MDQQEQTRKFFESAVRDWQNRSVESGERYNLIEARNRAVLSAIPTVDGARRFLDVGCGTGQLVLAVAGKGLEAEGIDFAEEMIAQCEANRREADVPAVFTCRSFFDMPVADGAYDIISAQGFIEYLSAEQMETFFARSAHMLRPGGALVVGSRNRLYNVVSLNDFTRIELDLGVLPALVAEAIALHSSPSQDTAFEALRKHERIDPQPDRHPGTGIAVDIRHQYAPAELVARLRRHGFAPRTLFPVHFHGLPPAVKAEHPEIHSRLAALMDGVAPADQRLVPFCSTFVLDVRRAG